tara:strand:- start:4054 stop:4773 length:720 start_codon:yes stop_codon:yes gene_type:complete
MSKNFKLFLGISYLIILTSFLYLIFLYIDLNRLNEFAYYKEAQASIEKVISDNFYLNIIGFFIFSIVWVSLLGFGSPILLISGIFFGKWIGTILSVASISLGALLLYSIFNFFFKEYVKSLLEIRFSKYINIFKKNEFIYFFAFRLAGGFGIPFGLQNILPVIFNINKKNYFFGSLFGFIPIFFIWNTIGSGLNKFIKQSDEFSLIELILTKEIFIPVILFIFLAIVSIFIRKKIFDNE